MGEHQSGRIIIHVDPELEELIPGYLENRRKNIVSIREALERDDYDIIESLGHSMRGSGGGYGFDDITDLGKSLEQAARDRDSHEISKNVTKLQDYLDRVGVLYG